MRTHYGVYQIRTRGGRTRKAYNSILTKVEALPRLSASGMIFRSPSLLINRDRVLDPLVHAMRPSANHLLSQPIPHDGEPRVIDGFDLADDWKYDDDVPVLEMVMANAIPAVKAEKVKIIALDCDAIIVSTKKAFNVHFSRSTCCVRIPIALCSRLWSPSSHLRSINSLRRNYWTYTSRRKFSCAQKAFRNLPLRSSKKSHPILARRFLSQLSKM